MAIKAKTPTNYMRNKLKIKQKTDRRKVRKVEKGRTEEEGRFEWKRTYLRRINNSNLIRTIAQRARWAKVQ